jgi:phenylpyruvate tautomerase PptA (4-oxalocrotonate tautomerase family)
MPMIDLTFPEGALDEAACTRLIDSLSAALLRHEGAHDNEVTRAMCWAFVHPVPRHAVFVGGRPAPVSLYRVIVTVPEGTLLHGPGPFGIASRDALVEEVTQLVLEAEGGALGAADRGRVYVIVREVPDGHWGALGRTVRIGEIASAAGGDDQSDFSVQVRESVSHLTTAAG